MKRFATLTAFLLFTIMASCQEKKDVKLATLDNIPDIIDGSACYLSETTKKLEKEKYVLVFDYAAYAVMNINKKEYIMTLTDFDAEENIYVYRAEGCSLTLHVVDYYPTMKLRAEIKGKSLNPFSTILYGRCEE